jgi:uncharacterized protein YcbX
MKPCGRCITLLADPNGSGATRDGEPLLTLRRIRHVTNVMPQSSALNKSTYADTPLFGVNMRHGRYLHMRRSIFSLYVLGQFGCLIA